MLLYIESVNAKGVPFSGLKYKGASKWLGDLSLLFKKTGNIKWPKTKTSIDTHFGIYHRKCQHIFIRKESKVNIYIAQEMYSSVQFSSVAQSCQLFATPWTAPCQAYLSITYSQSLPKLMSIESVIPSDHLILCHPFLLPPSTFPSIRVFSSRSVLRIRFPHLLAMRWWDWMPWS